MAKRIPIESVDLSRAEKQNDSTTEQQNDRTAEKKKGVKVSFYIDRSQSLALDDLSLALKKRGIRKSKSELIRESINLILKKYGG